MKQIDSLQNPWLKKVLRWLQKPVERRKEGVVLVEGIREVQRAIASGWALEQLSFSANHWTDAERHRLFPEVQENQWISVGAAVWSKMVVRENVPNVLGLFASPDASISTLAVPLKGLVLVVSGVEKPGTIGALFRTADAVGVDAVLLVDGPVDALHPQAIRNSLGGIFSTPWAVCTFEEARQWLSIHRFQAVLGHLEASQSPFEADLSGPVAIVVGPEDTGLSDQWYTLEGFAVKIPMNGLVDSLNVSVSAAVLLYEAYRQKKPL